MNKLLIILSLYLFTSSCSIKQEPIRFGKDACDHCKMTIMDTKFGASILTKKGKNFKFDDVNCVVNYINTNINDESLIARIAVIDYGNPETLIHVDNAYFVSSDEVKSPMASGIAAFSSDEKSSEFIHNSNGILLNWEEIRAKFE